jgi:hypothetical protein
MGNEWVDQAHLLASCWLCEYARGHDGSDPAAGRIISHKCGSRQPMAKNPEAREGWTIPYMFGLDEDQPMELTRCNLGCFFPGGGGGWIIRCGSNCGTVTSCK